MRLDARFFFFLAMYSLFSYISDIEFQEKKKKTTRVVQYWIGSRNACIITLATSWKVT